MATKCPISRSQFTGVKSETVKVHGIAVSVDPRTFSTKSLGAYGTAKGTMKVNGVDCPAIVSVNVTLIGSKELPEA